MLLRAWERSSIAGFAKSLASTLKSRVTLTESHHHANKSTNHFEGGYYGGAEILWHAHAQLHRENYVDAKIIAVKSAVS